MFKNNSISGKLLSINLYLLLIICSISKLYGAKITYELSGGRFGDNLISYCHCKWLCLTHNIPLIYKPFQYSDQLAMHYLEKYITTVDANKKILLKKNLEINIDSNSVYSVPYFGEDITEHRKNKHWVYFKVDWDNTEFKQYIKKTIKPINLELLKINLPKDCINIAVHVRQGGGYDQPLSNSNIKSDYYVDVDFPLKFPPLSFYIEQIKKISEIFQHSKLYIYIFTDDSNPEALVSKIKEGLQDYHNMIFDFRIKYNKHNKNVIEDFFAMTQFDCLIRSQSNFSFMAAKISDYKVEIFPTDYITTKNQLIINKIKIAPKDKPTFEIETNLIINIPKKVSQQNKKAYYKKKK